MELFLFIEFGLRNLSHFIIGKGKWRVLKIWFYVYVELRIVKSSKFSIKKKGQ